MTTISAKTKDQVLTAVESPTVASGDKNTVDFSVELDEFWSGLTASAVFFTARNPQAVYEKILEKGKTQIPSEVLKNKGYMYIGIRAVDGEGGVKTSTVLKYRIEDGAPVGTATAEGPTPDVYQQLSLALNNLKTGVDKNATGISNNSDNIEKLNEITESLNKDSSAAKMAIEELADKKITKFYASNLGENHLEDSDNGKIQDMFIYGRSEQKKYNGYNLFNIQEIRKIYSLEVNSIEHERVDFKMLNTGYCYAEIKLKCASGEKYRFSLSKKHNDLIVIVAGDIGLTNTNTYSWNVQANAPLIFTTKTEIINIRFAVNSTSIIEGILLKT